MPEEDTRRTSIGLLVVVILVLAGVLGCSGRESPSAPKQAEKITLAVTPWPASAPLYIAYEQGYFRDEGLDVTLDSYISGHLGLAAVLSGKADLAAAADTPIARAVVDGEPLAVVATVSEIDRAIRIIARKDKGISAPDDLKGRKIGLVAGTAAEFFLHIYLTSLYLNPQDVQIVNLATDQVVDALLSGEVDAVSTWSPHTLVLRDKLAGNALVLPDLSLYTMTWNIVATREFAKNNPQRIEKFMRAILRANRFIQEHTAEARAMMAQHIGTDSALYESEWQDYSFTAVLDQSLIFNLEDQARWMIRSEAGRARPGPNFMDFIDADRLKAVQPEAVRIAGE
jgi:NitT/TauT family transport system substrate-binding protein